MKRLLHSCGVLLLVLYSFQVSAQDRTVSGRVTSSEDGAALPGVSVVLKGTNVGVQTDAEGRYSISVPGTGTLTFSFIGMKTQSVEIGNLSEVNVSMQTDAAQLDEIVVTGVVAGTSTKKLGFSIAKVGGEQLSEVPATDAGNALRGKVSGLQVVQGSGRPGTAPAIRLRGVTAISGSQQPLIILDGIITNGSLADINMNDIESIEVLKGAAGSSLYGSLAGNGVIQLISKRGSGTEGVTRITVRNEFGMSELARKVPLAYHHQYQLNSDGSYVLGTPGNNNSRIAEADAIMDNEYPGRTYDNQELLFQPKPYMTNYAAIAFTGAKTTVNASFENLTQGGIVVDQAAFKRQNVRFNADHSFSDKFKLTTSTLFTQSSSPTNGENGQGGLFYPILAHEPDQDLEGTKYTGFLPRTQSNLQNPLYEVRTLEYERFRKRLLNNVNLSWKLTDWWRLEGQYSMDYQWNNNQDYTPSGYVTQQNQNGTPGSMSQLWNTSGAQITTASSYFTKKFGDFNLLATLRYQYERYTYKELSAGGSNFIFAGTDNFEALDPATFTIANYETEVLAENLFFNLGADYKDKYIFEGLVRRDGSSLFGSEERYQIFYRATGAYRVTQDFQIPGVQELKVRASYGTSGARPPFVGQYQIYNLSRGGFVQPNNSGNNFLKPARIGEMELGLNASFLNRFTFEFNYAKIKAEDQILEVRVGAASLYAQQYQNAGTVETNAFEIALGATILENDNFTWNANLVGSKSVSKVTSLGVPTILRGDGITSGMFRIKEGEEFGIMYGNTFATSPNDFILDNNGHITNVAGYVPNGTANRVPGDYEKNSDGYMVRTGTQYTPNERATLLYDPSTGQKLDTKIGNSRPDFLLGLSQTLTYKNFSLYLLLDAQIGGDIYNSTKQNLYFQNRHADLDQAGKPVGQRKAINYYADATSLYNGASPASHFVEDATYLKVRELSLGYKFGNEFLNKVGIGNILYDAKISLVGRNLLTFTDYTGFDPEVASLSAGDPTTFRSDAYVYPMFRTYAVSIELRF